MLNSDVITQITISVNNEGVIQMPTTTAQREPTDLERRCVAASDEQISAVQKRLRACAKAASRVAPVGAPSVFLQAINDLRTNPESMLDVAPELRQTVEDALTAVGA